MAEPPTLATAGGAALAAESLAKLQAEAEALSGLPADTAAELVGVAGRFLMVPSVRQARPALGARVGWARCAWLAG